MRNVLKQIGLVAAACSALVAGVNAQSEPEARFIRVVEEDDGGVIRLEIAIREYGPIAGEGPVVSLAGAVHIADEIFYEQLQEYLDSLDVVLFEGVKPPGAGDVPIEASDERRAQLTKRRLRFIATMVEMYRRDNGTYPEHLSDLAAGLGDRVAMLVAEVPTDAWGKPLLYEFEQRPLRRSTFDVVSLGSDGVVGGESTATDLAFSDQPELTKDEISADESDGIQGQLADALGLAFQLNAMDNTGLGWRNSDMSMDEIMDLLDSSGVTGDALFGALSGESFMAKVMGFALKLVGSSPTMQTTLKVMLVDMLAMADRVLAAVPGEMGALMEVLIQDRNGVVMDDLGGIMADEPAVRTIGIVYGAGHLADLEMRLGEIGYQPIGETWLPAIKVDLSDAGISERQLKFFRGMMKRSLEQSLEQMEK